MRFEQHFLNALTTERRPLIAKVLLLAALSLGCESAIAQQRARTLPTMIGGSMLVYPQQAKADGHQGTAVIRTDISAEGTVTGVAIARSSKSALLDDAALEFVRTSQFSPALDQADRPMSLQVAIPVEYVKDSVSNLAEKTCADFDIDMRWFLATYPDKKVGDMRLYLLSLGLFAQYDLISGTKTDFGEYPRTFAKAFDVMIRHCREHPEDRYLIVLKRSMAY